MLKMTSETLSLLQKLKNLPAEKSRAAGALLGAAVADAAARPLHWIYDEDELKRVLGDKVKISSRTNHHYH